MTDEADNDNNVLPDNPVQLRPVVLNGETLLFDIYVDNKWIGSRRTINACKTYLGWHNE